MAIDTNPAKFKIAKKFGATHCVNPKEFGSSSILQSHLIELTDGGFDYTFECVGNVDLMRIALESCHKVIACLNKPNLFLYSKG